MFNNIPDTNEPLGDKIFKQHQVWQYPFNNVKKDNTNGWFIDWTDFQGGIPNIDSVNIGHKIADQALNMTPYWEVNYVDYEKGVIFLIPIEPNPFITGVGAGGAPINERDMEVFSGEYEDKRTDQILQDIQEGMITDPRDVSYILKGTVPLHVGPNGSQGGWYSPNETSFNRGGREGLRPKDIMQTDSQSLKKLKFSIPIKALNGTMDTNKWKEFVESNGSNDIEPDYQTEGENYKDPKTSAQFVLNHVQPSIKLRNYKAILGLFDKTPQKELRQLVDDGKLDEYNALYDQKWDAYKKGELVNKELEPLVHSISGQIADMVHPTQDKKQFDPYWYLKEHAIQIAQKFKWMDVLNKFEGSQDKTNRKYVAIAYSRLGDKKSIMRMIEKETDEETLKEMKYWLKEVGNK